MMTTRPDRSAVFVFISSLASLASLSTQDTKFIAIFYYCEKLNQLLGLTFGIVYCFSRSLLVHFVLLSSPSAPRASTEGQLSDLIIVRKNLLSSEKLSRNVSAIYRLANN
jgi:hypothetical protein